MSAPYENDLSNTFKSYISTPASQINLGYTLTSFWYTSAFYLGLFFVSVALLILGLREDYNQGNVSKKPVVILAYVGVSLILFSLWTTVSSFYGIVQRITVDIRKDPKLSLFQRETTQNVLNKYESEYTEADNLNSALEKLIFKKNLQKNESFTSADANYDSPKE